MTCLMRLDSTPGSRRCRALTWLLLITLLVRLLSSPRVFGTGTTWTEPLIMVPEYCVSGAPSWPPGGSRLGSSGGQLALIGVSGPHGFGPAPESWVLTTTRPFPSGVTATLAGYQEVGMNPSTRRLLRLTTVTAFSPASLTYRV